MKNLLNSIKTAIKNVSLKLLSVLKKLSNLLWNYFLIYFYLFFKYIYIHLIKPIYKMLNKVIIKIYDILKIVILFFYQNIIKPVASFAYSYVIIPGYNALNELIIKIYKILKTISLFIYRNFIYKIFLVLKHIILFIKNSVVYIWKVILKILKYINKLIINTFKAIIYLYFRLPEFLYNIIYTFLIYIVLIIHFILFETVFKVLIKLPYKLLYNLFNLIFKSLNNFFKFFFKHLKSFFMYIKELIIKTVRFIRDYSEYIITIILMPFLLPIIIILTLVMFILELPKYFNIINNSILNIRLHSDYEIILIKYKYNPIKTLYLNLRSYYINLKIENYKSNGFKNFIINLKIINNKFIIKLILFPILSLLLSPLMVFSLFNSKSLNLDEATVFLNNKTNGIIYFKNIKYKNNIITINIKNNKVIELRNNLICLICEDDKVNIDIIYNDQIFKTLSLSYQADDLSESLIIFEEIKEELIRNNYYKFKLPLVNNEFNINYVKVYNRDSIDGNNFTLRTGFNYTELRVQIFKDKRFVLENSIKINNLINVRDLKEKTTNKVLIKHNESLKKFVPSKFNIKFKKSKYNNEEGLILTKDNIHFTAKYYIIGFEEEVYDLNVEVLSNEETLLKYVNKLEENFLDHNNKTLTLNNIIINNEYIKEVIYFIDNDELNDESDLSFYYNKLMNDRSTEVGVMFLFNNKYIFNQLNIEREVIEPNLFNMIISNHFKHRDNNIYVNIYNFKNIISNKNYLKLPKTYKNSFYIIRWKSLNKNVVKSNGYIKDNNFKNVEFKIIIYKNLFKKEVFKVNIIFKGHDIVEQG